MGLRGIKNPLAPAPPASLESLHRIIMGSAHDVEKETINFQQTYLSSNPVNNLRLNDMLEDFLREMAVACEKDIADLQDFSELELFVTTNKDKEKLDADAAAIAKKSKGAAAAKKEAKAEGDINEEETLYTRVNFGDLPEYRQLKLIFDMSKAFDFVAFSMKNKIADAFSRLQTYCLSFIQETKGEFCNTVQDYENRIISWKQDLTNKLNYVDDILDEYDVCKNKAIVYVGDFNSVMGLQKKICRHLISMCDPIKKWVTSDSTYARRLQEEISQYNRQKLEVQGYLRHIEDDREKLSLAIKRKSFQVCNLEKEIDRERESKKNMRRREADMQENLAKFRADARRKRRDLDEAKAKFNLRRDSTPGNFNYQASMIESLKHDVRTLESRCAMMHKNVIALQKDQEVVQIQITAIDRELRDCRAAHDQLYQKLEKLDYTHWKHTDQFQQLENKITALKKIREIKLHTNTVKKIFHFGYHAGHMQDRDELEDAIRIASEAVGKEWAYLYRKLPFKPPRGFEERSHDLEVIDISSRRVQSGGFRTVTYKSLSKWRRLHHSASLVELVKTLKRIRKTDVARRIQKEVLVQSPIAKSRPKPYGHISKNASKTV